MRWLGIIMTALGGGAALLNCIVGAALPTFLWTGILVWSAVCIVGIVIVATHPHPKEKKEVGKSLPDHLVLPALDPRREQGYTAHIGSKLQDASASPAENAQETAQDGDGTSNLRRTGASK